MNIPTPVNQGMDPETSRWLDAIGDHHDLTFLTAPISCIAEVSA